MSATSLGRLATGPTARTAAGEHVTFILPSLEMGGMEKFVILLGAALRKRGHDVSVVCTRTRGALANAAEAEGLVVREVPFRSRWDNVFPRDIAAALRSLGTTVAHTQSGSWLAGAIAARRVGARVVHTEHGMTRRPEPWTLALQKRIAHALTDATVVVSSTLQRELAGQLHIPLTALQFIANGIPTAAFARDVAGRNATRAQLGVATDTVLVGCVARLQNLKGVDLLAEATAGLPAALGMQVCVVGDGEDRARIEQAAARSRVPFRLLGQRDDVRALMHAFDILVLPSRSEALPLALLEGMAAGATILASAVGEIPSVVGNEAGVLVPAGDVDALRSALQALVTDAPRRAALATAAVARVGADFDLGRMVDRYEDTYRAVARRR